jgi:predicted RNA methylase
VNALAIIKAAMKPRADAPTPSWRPVSPVSPVLLVSPVSLVHQLPQVPEGSGLPSVPASPTSARAASAPSTAQDERDEWVVYVAPKGGDPNAPPPPALVRALGPGPAERAVAAALGQPAERCMAVPRNPSLHADAVPLEDHPLALPNADEAGARLARLVKDPGNLTREDAALPEVAAMERRFRGQFRVGDVGPHGEAVDDWTYVRAVAVRIAEEQRPALPRPAKPARAPRPASEPRPAERSWIVARTSRPPNEVSDHVLDLLSEMTVEGSILKRHPRQLTVDDHAALYKVLRALGATWKGGRTQGYVFQPGVNVPALIESVLTTGQYLNPRSFDFVETPRALADALCEQAHVVAGERALEPSAGKGSIADALRRRGAIVTMVELLEANAADLVAVRGFEPARVHQGDFLEMTLADLGGDPFDVVLMNPPFGTRPFVDIEHVLHAFAMVRPGGRLVAVMSKGVQYRRAPKAQRFRVFASHHGTMENLPDGSFAASGTNARAVLVTLHRGANEFLHLGVM